MNDELFRTLCSLAGLYVSEAERPRIQERMGAVLNYVEQLQRMDMNSAVERVLGCSSDALRSDTEQTSSLEAIHAISSQYIQSAGDQLVVPAVLGRDT